MDNKKPLFTAGLRTPFARAHKGAYREERPDDLLVKLLLEQKRVYARVFANGIEDIIVGCAYPEGEQGYNIARMVSLGAGLNAPGLTVNRLCASSLEAIAIASARVNACYGDNFLVGGVESMTMIPRGGANPTASPGIVERAPHAYITMGETAENVCSSYPNISREKQEVFAARSHELADAAYRSGNYDEQLYKYKLEQDELIRVPVDLEKMASLKPAFREDGVVTAASSSPLSDGATSGLVLSVDAAREAGFSDGLEIVDVSWAHVAPEEMGLGPIPAVRSLLARHELAINAIDAFEINEAFAIQTLACIEELEVSLDRVNNWGGALALGHPLGASGLRLAMTLHLRLRKLAKENALGIATLCVGGGQGMAVLFRYRAL